ncbi:MAG: hypothetical protein AAF386_10870, partial [Pseudomonadota bacterium]
IVLLIVIKLIEGFALDTVRSQQGQVWLVAAPIVFGVVVSVGLILRRDKPWRDSKPMGPAA